jgi:hypothetical protein
MLSAVTSIFPVMAIDVVLVAVHREPASAVTLPGRLRLETQQRMSS